MTPTIVLVPGMACIGTVYYVPLKTELETLGFKDIIILDCPSVDSVSRLAELQPTALHADINFVHQQLLDIAGKGKDIIIVGHSYGGTVVLHATEGLWRDRRRSQGLSGGVLKAVLLSSSLTLPGQSVAGVRAAWVAENMSEMDTALLAGSVSMHDGIPVLDPAGLESVFFSDMTAEEQTSWGAKGSRPTPLTTVMTDAPAATVTDWRISYLITEALDPNMPVAFQEFLIESGRKHGAIIDEVKRVTSGHFVHVSHAGEVARWIEEVSS